MTFPDTLPKSIFSEDKEHIVTKEFDHITIKCNDFDLSSSSLGAYYLDMREIFFQYQAAILGDFDSNGVPMVGWGKYAHYSPVTIAQYGFAIHDLWLTNKNEDYLNVLNACLNKLIEMESREGNTIFWREKHASERYQLKDNWASAMTQGECLSFYLRMYQLTKDDDLLNKSHQIFNSFEIPVSQNGVTFTDSNNNIWLEEYPSTPPSFVLNGYIYGLLGIVDYYRITKSEKAKTLMNKCFTTLANNIALYDAGYWSYYDLYYKELVKYYYQKNVHVPQLDALYKLTGNKIFNQYSIKWEKQLTSLNYIFVQIMYRIKPRLRKIQLLFK